MAFNGKNKVKDGFRMAIFSLFLAIPSWAFRKQAAVLYWCHQMQPLFFVVFLDDAASELLRSQYPKPRTNVSLVSSVYTCCHTVCASFTFHLQVHPLTFLAWFFVHKINLFWRNFGALFMLREEKILKIN